MIFILIVKAFYFMLPAYFANMAPVIVKRLFKNLAIAIDSGRRFGNKPILGSNKTWRGLVFGIIFAIVISFLQFLFYNNNIFADISLVDYSNWLLFGFLMGFGALLGDMTKSFFKRRLGYAPGKPFIPFDQLDFVVGALLFTYPLVKLPIGLVITTILLSFFLDIAVNHISYYLKIRNEKW